MCSCMLAQGQATNSSMMAKYKSVCQLCAWVCIMITKTWILKDAMWSICKWHNIVLLTRINFGSLMPPKHSLSTGLLRFNSKPYFSIDHACILQGIHETTALTSPLRWFHSMIMAYSMISHCCFICGISGNTIMHLTNWHLVMSQGDRSWGHSDITLTRIYGDTPYITLWRCYQVIDHVANNWNVHLLGTLFLNLQIVRMCVLGCETWNGGE